MKLLSNIIIILMVVMVTHPGYAKDETQEVSYALELVNKIRQDPLAYAEEIGLDRETLRQELPWLVDILDKGLPGFSPSEALDELAREENSFPRQDMIEETGTMDDGEPIKTPLGSDRALTGKMGGVVSFYSFMPPEFAWEIVIRNQFEQELKSDMQGPLYILNPGFDSMGLAMRGGRNKVGDEVKNAYFVTICLASSRLKVEAQVLNMVNQVRYNSDSIETYLGVSLFKLLNYDLISLSKWFWLYPPLRNSSDFPPLFENLSLQDSSRYRVKSLFLPEKYSPQGMDSASPEPPEHKVYQGSEESFALAMVRPDITSDHLAATLFISLLDGEFKSPLRKGAIFSIGTNEGGVGIAFLSGTDRIEQAGVVLHARVTPFDDLSSVEDPPLVDGLPPAEDPDKSQARIYGVVFSDTDGNEIYSPGEGKERMAVNVYRQLDDVLVSRTFTDASGHFSVIIEKDLEYRFEIPSGETPISFLKLVDKSLFLPVDLSCH